MRDDSANDYDNRRRRVEAMLWVWAESDPARSGHAPGHPSSSPTYRMMREGMPGARRSRATGQWRQKVRRRGDYSVELTPAATCHGTETRTMRMPERTAPEMDAERMGTPYTIARIVREDMTPDMQTLVYARFVDRIPKREIPDHVDIAGLNKNTLPLLYRQVIETVARQVIGSRGTAENSQSNHQATTA